MSKIQPSDIEAKLRQLETEANTAATAAMPAALGVGIAVVTGLTAVAYFIGQRSAKKRTTVVEIRRV